MKRSIPLAFITLGVVLSLVALSLLILDRSATVPIVDLPHQLAGLPLSESQQGTEAITVITNLHGKQFPVDYGAVGIYGNREITVWVAGAASESIALEMTNAMERKIAEGNSPFTPIDQINTGSRKVYALKGMGQTHYYFQSQSLVIWLAVSPVFADEALQQILEVYS